MARHDFSPLPTAAVDKMQMKSIIRNIDNSSPFSRVAKYITR
jgi:hypothetical protein